MNAPSTPLQCIPNTTLTQQSKGSIVYTVSLTNVVLSGVWHKVCQRTINALEHHYCETPGRFSLQLSIPFIQFAAILELLDPNRSDKLFLYNPENAMGLWGHMSHILS